MQTRFEDKRKNLLKKLQNEGIRDSRVLEAMGMLPREKFIFEKYSDEAYVDSPVAIGEGQTISQPYIVAVMLELLELSGRERVLEIGTGSGYNTALLSLLALEVFSVERFPNLYEQSKNILEQLRCKNIHLLLGDGKQGWKKYAPYERIVLTAAPVTIPPELFNQLDDGGIMVAPVGLKDYQVLKKIRKEGNKLRVSDLFQVSFVPLQ